MYVPNSSIIDNDKTKLAEELKKILLDQKTLDIATGYVNIGGYALIADELKQTQKFRLLIGKTPEIDDYPSKNTIFNLPSAYKSNIKTDIEKEKYLQSSRDATKSLIDFLKQSNVEVRIYKGNFLHGKAFIFDKLIITGSSNFTYSGLTLNTELNAVLLDVHAEYVRREWFDKFWNDPKAEDFKQTFIDILEDSKFGNPKTPYDVYLKALYELQKKDISAEITEKKDDILQSKVELTEFQVDAVNRVYSRLKKYNGVMIADSVGLGKTWIAKRVIEEFGFFRRKNFLIVCPAQIKDNLWRKELKDIGLSENIISQETLGRDDFDFNSIHKLQEAALIVVDESHNFRSPFSNRYEKLFTLIEKATTEENVPKVLLMTATPINNTIWDLYFQLMLISRNDKKMFIKDGITDLFEKFKEMDKKGTPAMLNDILHQVSIRRTRQYIRDNYPDSLINGQKVVFPDRKLITLNYKLNDSYKGFYKQISGSIENDLQMTYYKFEEFRILGQKDNFELGRMEALSGIIKTILLKRLESSVESFRKSIDNQIKFLKYFLHQLRQGNLLKKQYFNKYVELFNEQLDMDAQTFAKEIEQNFVPINLVEYNSIRLIEGIEKDIKVMEDLYDKVKNITEEQDAKLIEFKKHLLNIKGEGKILLFTFYSDTLNYIYNALLTDKKFAKQFGKKIDKIEGSCSINQRLEKIDDFLKGDTYLLMSTDLLSEGQNLQIAKSCINYDLHWNPTRMIQRAGRIDRIGSPYKEINVYNFFPEDELDELLNLVKILQKKIRSINESIGLDASVLGETINPKVFGVLKDIKEEKNSVWDDLEKEQFGGGEMFWEPLRKFLKESTFHYLDNLPDGIYSGLKRNYQGIFFYYQYAEEYHFWYLYDLATKKLLTNKTQILDYISCNKSEKTVLPDDLDIVFNINAQIVENIQATFHQTVVDVAIRGIEKDKFIKDIVSELEFIKREHYSEEQNVLKLIDETIPKLSEITFTKRRIRDLRRIWNEYRTDKNSRIFIKQLIEFCKEKKILIEQESEEFDETNLRLICVDYIS
jgi:superfamily II DNA or RNA helicase